MDKVNYNSYSNYARYVLLAVIQFFCLAIYMPVYGQGNISADIKFGGKGFIPGRSQQNIELLLTNSNSKTIIVESVDLYVHNYKPYNIYTFPNKPLAPPRRIQLAVYLDKHKREYQLYDITDADMVISIKKNSATVFDVVIKARDKGLYNVTIEINWHYLDNPGQKNKYISKKHNVKFPDVQRWEKLASTAERVYAYFKYAHSMKTFLLKMGLVKKGAVQEWFGNPAIKMEGSGVLSILFEKNGKYIPFYMRDIIFPAQQEINIIIAKGCGIDGNNINYAKSTFHLSNTSNPRISSSFVDCNSSAWSQKKQAMLFEGKHLNALIIHDYGIGWAHDAKPGELKSYIKHFKD